ncbi:MAG: hypothetical protein GY842_02265 [bacterium]|nr:hypothetical protein [bacterium]
MAGAVLVVLWLIPLGGCFAGSLATSTGPRTSGDWSVCRDQAAHVGETVRFSFILTQLFRNRPIDPGGLADYCMISFGDEWDEADLDEGGRFILTRRIPREWRSREISVVASAYRKYGQRDRVALGGELLHADAADDPADPLVAYAEINLLVYQSSVEFELTAGADGLDFDTARMLLRTTDGLASTVPRARPPVGGFTVQGPTDGGIFTVQLEPRYEQINRTGTTQAEFIICNRAGQEQRHQIEFLTP